MTLSRRDWILILACIVLAACLPLALSDAGWLEDNRLLWLTVLSGALLALLLARSSVRTVWAWSALSLAGLGYTVQFQSRSLPPLNRVLLELWAGFRWLWSRVFSDFDAPSPFSWKPALERLNIYLAQLKAEWPPEFAVESQSDRLLEAGILGLTVWLAIGLVVWLAARSKSGWGVMLVVTGVLAVNTFFAGRGWMYLVTGILFSLPVLIEFNLRALESTWRESVFDALAEDWWLLGGVCILVVGASLLAAIGLTNPALREGLRRDGETGAGPGENRSSPSAPGTWPRSHLLDAGPDLQERPAMTVRTPGAPAGSFYWRAAVYDEYTGRGWRQNTSAVASSANLSPWPASPDPPPGSVLLMQEFQLTFETRQIYAAGRPVGADLAVSGLWFDASGHDLLALRSQRGVTAYRVTSWVSAAGEAELRQAAGEIPDWLLHAYTQLPDDLPERVTALAMRLTAGQATPYDQAQALETALRAYEYSLDVPAPPPDQDAVDWYLFDLRKGYCDYAASSMVVLARSLGLPARLAVGYATGTYDPQAQAYHVSLADAHAWAEIYLPPYGWIPFEPTGGMRRAGPGLPPGWSQATLETAPDLPGQASSGEAAGAIQVQRAWGWLAGLGGLGLLALACYVLARSHYNRLRRLPVAQVVWTRYRDVQKQSARLGLDIPASQTPHEFLENLLAVLESQTRLVPPRLRLNPEQLAWMRTASSRVVNAYAAQIYSPRPVDAEVGYNLLADAPRLGRLFWLYVFYRLAFLRRGNSQ